MNNQVYISCPESVNYGFLDLVGSKVQERNYKPKWYDREDFIKHDLIDADTLVVILPAISFNHPLSTLSSMQEADIETAKNMGKAVYLAYNSRSFGIQFYQVDITTCYINGIAGTSEKGLPEYITPKKPLDLVDWLNDIDKDDVPLDDVKVKETTIPMRYFDFHKYPVEDTTVDKRAYLLVG
jgi:hypothetical protein